MEKAKYYVYVYLDPTKKGEFVYGDYKFDYEPFYVGKGCGNRYLKHLTETKEETYNLIKFRVINKLNKLGIVPIIIKVKTTITEKYAYKIETELIKLIGRRCDESGPLTNIVTDANPPTNYIKLTNAIVKEIIGKYNSGMFLKHIGDDLNLNENKIKRVLVENGITPKRRPPINKKLLTNDLVNMIVDDYNNGLSIRKIKDKFRLSFETVRNTLKVNKVILRGYDYVKTQEHKNKLKENRKIVTGEEHHSFRPLSIDEIIKLKKLRFEENKSIREIMCIMNITQNKYYYYINL